jgi:hypothetical protein
LIYVTHTQAHATPKHQQIRKNELDLIRSQMRYDRFHDFKAGIERGGHYYLMGDLNVGNVDDEHIHDANGGYHGEYDNLHAHAETLSDHSFFDPYLEEHSVTGERIKGTPLFLEKDVKNHERVIKSWKPIDEPAGSFYFGPDQKDRKPEGYGTKNFYKGSHPTVRNCRYDYILRLKCEDDYASNPIPKFTGKAEIRHVLPNWHKVSTTSTSDHAMVSAIFEKTI